MKEKELKVSWWRDEKVEKVHRGGRESGRSGVFTAAHIYIVLKVYKTGAHGKPCAMLPSARKLGHQ